MIKKNLKLWCCKKMKKMYLFDDFLDFMSISLIGELFERLSVFDELNLVYDGINFVDFDF